MKNNLKGITVPYRYYDKEDNYFYYIYKNKAYTDLSKLFNKFLGSYLTYHFKIDKEIKEVYNLSDVLDCLLKNYDKFQIPKKYENEYSKGEYEYIIDLQNKLKDNKLIKPYFQKRIFKTNIKELHLIRFNREIYYKYQDVEIPKRVRSKVTKKEYYVLAGDSYQSIYDALDQVNDNNIYYQFGGTKKINNRTHSRAHNFDDLIELIFAQSDKFVIHKFQRECYSKQELEFLDKLATKLKEMDFHSVEYEYDSLETDEYSYLKDSHRYIGLLFHTLRYHRKHKQYEKRVIESHKI